MSSWKTEELLTSSTPFSTPFKYRVLLIKCVFQCGRVQLWSHPPATWPHRALGFLLLPCWEVTPAITSWGLRQSSSCLSPNAGTARLLKDSTEWTSGPLSPCWCLCCVVWHRRLKNPKLPVKKKERCKYFVLPSAGRISLIVLNQSTTLIYKEIF